jgi:hypothetical protein
MICHLLRIFLQKKGGMRVGCFCSVLKTNTVTLICVTVYNVIHSSDCITSNHSTSLLPPASICMEISFCSQAVLMDSYYFQNWQSSYSKNVKYVKVIVRFYVLLTLQPCIIFSKWSQLGPPYFLVYLFQLLYKFRATTCPSSGKLLYLCDSGIFHSVWVAVWSAD